MTETPIPVPTWDLYTAPSLRVLSDGEVRRASLDKAE